MTEKLIPIELYEAKLSNPTVPAYDGIEYSDNTGMSRDGNIITVFLRPENTGRLVEVLMEPITGNCTYTLNMYDSYGDGWNGAYLTVYIADVSMGTFTITDGLTRTEIFTVPVNSEIRLEYTAGPYDTEISYTLKNGNCIVFSDGPSPATGSVFTGTCSPCPVADFTFTDTPTPLLFSFTDTSCGNVEEWYWAFGDTGTSEEQNPQHQYAAIGSYEVTLTVYNGSCEPSFITKTVEVTNDCYWTAFQLNRWTPDYPALWELTQHTLYLHNTYDSGSGPFECTSQVSLTGNTAIQVSVNYWIGSGIPALSSGFSLSGSGATYSISVDTVEVWDEATESWIWKTFVKFYSLNGPIAEAEIETIDPFNASGAWPLKMERAGNALTAYYFDGSNWTVAGSVDDTAVAGLQTLKIFGGNYFQDSLSFSAVALNPCP